MPKTFKAKELARLYRQLRYFAGSAVAVESSKGGKTRILTEITLDTTAAGRPTTRRIHVLEDGRPKYYDGSYEFEVTALLLRGERHAVGKADTTA
jgi:hypothetical protein